MDSQNQDFEDFDEEIEAIMSGKGSKGSKGNNSKDSVGYKKGMNKRSNTVQISNSSKSSHKSSQFYKSKKSFKELPQSTNPTQQTNQINSDMRANYDIYSQPMPIQAHINNFGSQGQISRNFHRGNTSIYYEVDRINEEPENEEKHSEQTSNSLANPSLVDLDKTVYSADKIDYRHDMEEKHGRAKNIFIPLFYQVKPMSKLNNTYNV